MVEVEHFTCFLKILKSSYEYTGDCHGGFLVSGSQQTVKHVTINIKKEEKQDVYLLHSNTQWFIPNSEIFTLVSLYKK